ncbi:MAG: substrate-binding domain-containing protein [Anaerolineales bacterium]|nr:substrate-binding domain-containing protein [Anaerolineales bacterium]
MTRKHFWPLSLAFILALAFSLTGCGAQVPENPHVLLATTTSTQDSGLLDVLVPAFEAETGYQVQVVAVGTGQALTMGREGNADVLLVHAPGSEVEFMDGGYGSDRRLVMHNDFVLVGPVGDPAGTRGLSIEAALQAIGEAGAAFVSRGDDSGTHKKELALWTAAGFDPLSQAWYRETGQGMGATLTIASELAAYTLTDRATYLAQREHLDLEIVVEGDHVLLNVYHVIVVNPDLWPEVNHAGALAFADYLTAQEGQAIIAAFGTQEFGQPLFIPDADKTDADLGL